MVEWKIVGAALAIVFLLICVNIVLFEISKAEWKGTEEDKRWDARNIVSDNNITNVSAYLSNCTNSNGMFIVS